MNLRAIIILPCTLPWVLLVGCGTTGLTGDASTTGDSSVDEDPEIDSTPCDRDGDGHESPACGGDDCDDTRADVYPGALEICLDGVDQDCDGVVDGPMLMREPFKLSDDPVDPVATGSGPIWVGSAYMVQWEQALHPGAEYQSYFSYIGPEGDRIVESVELDRWPGLLAWTGSSFGEARIESDDILINVLDMRAEPLIDDTVVLSSGLHALTYFVWTGSHFNLFWNEYIAPGDIAHSRIGGDGIILEEPFYVTRLHEWGLSPGLAMAVGYAWTGSETCIVWNHRDMDVSDVYFISVPDTSTSVGEHRKVAESEEQWSWVSIAWTGSELGVAWASHTVAYPPGDAGGMWFARFGADGDMIGPEFSEIHPYGGYPSVDWTGSEFGLVFVSEWNEPERHIAFMRGDAGGSFENSNVEIPLPEHSEWPRTTWTRTTWSGSEFAILWSEDTDVSNLYFARIGFCE